MTWISTPKHRGPQYFGLIIKLMKQIKSLWAVRGVMQYRSGFSEKGCENGLLMVSHTSMLYSEESLLEYIEGETKVMVEELASM